MYDATSEWWWPWLTDVLIPGLGVLASTAVAIIAIYLATRDRRDDKRELNQAKRAEFAALLVQFARVNSARNSQGVPAPEALMAAAARLSPPMNEAIEWVGTQHWKARGVLFTGENGGWTVPAITLEEFLAEAEHRTSAWLEGVPFDLAPLPDPLRPDQV